MTELLLPSFFPHEKPPSVQLSRLLFLVRSTQETANRGAPQILAKHACRLMPLPAVCRLITFVYRLLVKSLTGESLADEDAEKIEVEGKQEKKPGKSRRSKLEEEDQSKKRRTKKQGSKRKTLGKETEAEEASESESGDELHSDDPLSPSLKLDVSDPKDQSLVTSLLAVMSTLWTSVAPSALRNSSSSSSSMSSSVSVHQSQLQAVVKVFSDGALQDLMLRLSGADAQVAVLHLASLLPSESVDDLSQSVVPHLLEVRTYVGVFTFFLFFCFFFM